ncbi:DUF3226 domain-containing protein [Helicobacter anatolicus]|uniref:DUF3226 domain-containing protein n=1 Tax=Helicobacter anatolicus TaxID=2905874 RepID=UPI001E58E12A|nr:DUF3226 domain-containing protein [Helicobacter anatolicus]MCE3038650.1 hypothetical protein [Helicobacter anatolicus]
MYVKIFVEGKQDREFLEVYLKYLGYSNAEILVCNGNVININIRSSIQEARDRGQKILVIFDSDDSCENTMERLIRESEELLSKSEIFLFPNNSQKGELETLLFAIAKEPQVCQCFEGYKTCISLYNPDYAKNIHKKSARYAYFEALGLLDEKKRKEAYSKVFDFDSLYLETLKGFLQKHC